MEERPARAWLEEEQESELEVERPVTKAFEGGEGEGARGEGAGEGGARTKPSRGLEPSARLSPLEVIRERDEVRNSI